MTTEEIIGRVKETRQNLNIAKRAHDLATDPDHLAECSKEYVEAKFAHDRALEVAAAEYGIPTTEEPAPKRRVQK